MYIFEFIGMCIYWVAIAACSLIQLAVKTIEFLFYLIEFILNQVMKIILFITFVYRVGYVLGQKAELAYNYARKQKPEPTRQSLVN